MSAAADDDKFRWAVSAAGALVMVVTLGILFGLTSITPRSLAPSGLGVPVRLARVQMAGPDDSDAVLNQEAETRDLRPLFLPTELNAALPEARLEAGRTFLDNESPKLGFTEAALSVGKELPPVVTLNGKPLTGAPGERAAPVDVVLAEGSSPALFGFGRSNTPVAQLRPRGGFIEVVATVSGQRVLTEELPPEARPPVDKPWEPLEFLATVDASGLAAPLVLTASSRVEEVDAYFRNFLTRRYRIGERLAPGFYRIVVGP